MSTADQHPVKFYVKLKISPTNSTNKQDVNETFSIHTPAAHSFLF